MENGVILRDVVKLPDVKLVAPGVITHASSVVDEERQSSG